MNASECVALADALLGAVLAAGRIEMDYFDHGVAVERKTDYSPVTAADREAESVLVAALATAAPGVPVIAEEASAAGHRPSIGDRFFLVDPLDGTSEFINKRSEFTVNIGLIEKGEPVFGIVYAPAMARIYATLGPDHAVAGDLPVAAAARRFAEIATRPIAARVPDTTGIVALASRSHRSLETETYLSRFNVREYKQAGSSIKFCLIASGDADLYPRIGPTSEWDTAAGHAILKAAGGRVAKLDGTPLRYGRVGEGFLNPHFVAWGRSSTPPERG